MVYFVVFDDELDVSLYHQSNCVVFYDSFETSFAKVKVNAICADQTVFIVIFTRQESLQLSAFAKSMQQNIFSKI